MKKVNIRSCIGFFRLLLESAHVQAWIMALKSGESSSPSPENEHPRAEQWVYVISGAGKAVINDRRYSLSEGMLLLIQQRETHQITNTGRRTLVTLNLYAPPAYTADGEVRRSIK